MNVTGLFEAPHVIDDSDLQISPGGGRLRHLLTLKTLGKVHIFRILDEAETFLSPLGHPAVRTQCLKGLTVANLFFEPSTRTQISS
jgi:aspartate carbamoyltransferase catalytic subunit